MPSALDRLLARSSALKLLRTILNSPEPGPYARFGLCRNGVCQNCNILDSIQASGTRSIHLASTRKARSEKPHNGEPNDGKPSYGKPNDGKPNNRKTNNGKPNNRKPNNGKHPNGKPHNGKSRNRKPQNAQPPGSEGKIVFQGVRYEKKAPWRPQEEQDKEQQKPQEVVAKTRKNLIRFTKVTPAPVRRPDYAWWAQLLQTRQRLHGSLGVRESWFGLRRHNIDLPTIGEHAEVFWETFLKDDALLEVVVQYAISLYDRTRRYYSLLHESVLRRQLVADPKSAMRFHLLLKDRFHLQRTFLQSIALTLPPDRAVLRVVREIYLSTNQKDVYDGLMTNLLATGKLNLAIEWDRFLLDQRENPSRRVLILFKKRTRRIGLVDTVKEAHVAPKAISSQTLNPLSREAINSAIGEAHFVKPKEVSDSFCAKIFATRFLAVDTIIRGLGGFGVGSIGPLALREMALRLENCKEISEKLGDLAVENVQVRECVFTAAVKRFATDNRDDLMFSLLQSDQHPEVLEDRLLQSQLLDMYISNEDYTQAERTLHILSLFHEDSPTEAWNKLFRERLRRSSLQNLEAASQIFQDMLYHRVPVTLATHITLRSSVLRPRRPSKRPVTLPAGLSEPGPDTLFVANCLLRMLETGQRLNPKVWGDVLLRIGKALPLGELERLCMWLVAYHHHEDAVFFRRQRRETSQQIRALALPRFKPGGDIATPLYTILNRHALRAIITWGFRAAMVHRTRAQSSETWTKGLELVCMFRDRGMVVHASMVKAELRRRFIMLFGSGRPRHRWGRRARLNNPFTLGHLVRECERIWGSRLFVDMRRKQGGDASQAQDEPPSDDSAL